MRTCAVLNNNPLWYQRVLCADLNGATSFRRFWLLPLAALFCTNAISGQSSSVTDDKTGQQINIRGSAERIFDALTKPNQVVKWWGTEGRFQAKDFESDLRVGGKWMINVDARGRQVLAGGEYRTVERPQLLVFTWIRRGEEEDPAETTVRIDLEEGGPGITTVPGTHSGPVTDALRRRNGGGPLMQTLLQSFIEGQS